MSPQLVIQVVSVIQEIVLQCPHLVNTFLRRNLFLRVELYYAFFQLCVELGFIRIFY
jgi:hypothetical protein